MLKKLLAGLALTAVAAAAQASIVVSFVPAATQIAVGESTTVEMRISGLGDEILSAFDVNMLFNASALFNGLVTFNVEPQFGGLANAVWGTDFGAGNNDVYGYSLLDDDELAASQLDAFTVLTFGFTGVADGYSTINLGTDPDFERNFVGRRFQTLDVTVEGTCIAVGTGSCDNRVPEPASYGLAGVALLAAGLAGRRRRQTKAAVSV